MVKLELCSGEVKVRKPKTKIRIFKLIRTTSSKTASVTSDPDNPPKRLYGRPRKNLLQCHIVYLDRNPLVRLST